MSIRIYRLRGQVGWDVILRIRTSENTYSGGHEYMHESSGRSD